MTGKPDKECEKAIAECTVKVAKVLGQVAAARKTKRAPPVKDMQDALASCGTAFYKCTKSVNKNFGGSK